MLYNAFISIWPEKLVNAMIPQPVKLMAKPESSTYMMFFCAARKHKVRVKVVKNVYMAPNRMLFCAGSKSLEAK